MRKHEAIGISTPVDITPALTSANTTAGINPAKAWRIPGTGYAGDDFEGSLLASIGGYFGFQLRHTAGTGGIEITKSDTLLSDTLGPNEMIQKLTSGSTGIFSLSSSSALTLTGATGYSKSVITLFFD